ncbi:MAG TPA: class I SAM-dependent methyltransferase [Anaerolineaceae bacterium]|nr:class I SAM-dependent methyltransferase [Anaerolineaceae bacterium]
MQIADWHKRYLEQAQWTKTLRRYLLSKIPIQVDWSILELGCGTGVILQDFLPTTKTLVGLDLDLNALGFQGKNPALLVNGDASHPPFQNNAFDLIYCHFFLLWLAQPAKVVELTKTMLKPGGYLAVYAEPDYASRKTAPETIRRLADLQNQSLAAQGAHLKIGRQLGTLLVEGGFDLLELGFINEAENVSQGLTESEKNVLRADWKFLHQIPEEEISKEELEDLLSVNTERWYVPTYYALAVLKN